MKKMIKFLDGEPNLVDSIVNNYTNSASSTCYVSSSQNSTSAPRTIIRNVSIVDHNRFDTTINMHR